MSSQVAELALGNRIRGSDAPGMHTCSRVAILFGIGCFVGCGGKPVPKDVLGLYVLDPGSVQAMSAINPTMQAFQSSIELRADFVAVMRTKLQPAGPEQENLGTWRLDGNKLTLTSKVDGAEKSNAVDLVAGTFTIQGDVGGKPLAMTFRKQ